MDFIVYYRHHQYFTFYLTVGKCKFNRLFPNFLFCLSFPPSNYSLKWVKMLNGLS
jgi:hypothetical protein